MAGEKPMLNDIIAKVQAIMSLRAPHDSPHLSDRSENICEQRLLLQRKGQASANTGNVQW